MKDRQTYKILSYIGFILPLNRFYIGNLKGIFWRAITLNYFWIGWITDLFYIDKRFDETMTKRGFTNTDIRNRMKS